MTQDERAAQLRAELLRRADLDQQARGRMGEEPDEMGRIDADNLPWIRQVIHESGWPAISAVGEDGARAAWLLVQHADSDPAFQRRCLDLLIAAADAGEAKKSDVAYLTDRVLLAEGKEQEFGTQLTGRDRKWVPRRLRDPAGVDRRRAAMSLSTLAEYLAQFPPEGPEPVTTGCPNCGEPIEFWVPEPGEEEALDCTACGQTLRIRVGEPP